MEKLSYTRGVGIMLVNDNMLSSFIRTYEHTLEAVVLCSGCPQLFQVEENFRFQRSHNTIKT